MAPLILAIILFVVDWLVPLPYPVHVILMVGAVIALIYGLWVLLGGWRGAGPVEPTTRRSRRWWY